MHENQQLPDCLFLKITNHRANKPMMKTSKQFEEMLKLFDPASVARMSSVMDKNRQNYEAMLKANQAATTTYNQIYQEQMAILQIMMEGAKEIAESEAVTSQPDFARKQAEIYNTAVERAMADMTELANESRKATQAAASVIGKRVEQSIADLKKL